MLAGRLDIPLTLFICVAVWYGLQFWLGQGVVKVNHDDDVAAKATHSKLLHKAALIPIREHAQKTESLSFAGLSSDKNVEPCDLAKTAAYQLQLRLQVGVISAVPEVLNIFMHGCECQIVRIERAELKVLGKLSSLSLSSLSLDSIRNAWPHD